MNERLMWLNYRFQTPKEFDVFPEYCLGFEHLIFNHPLIINLFPTRLVNHGDVEDTGELGDVTLCHCAFVV
jgi:hypothetical protein